MVLHRIGTATEKACFIGLTGEQYLRKDWLEHASFIQSGEWADTFWEQTEDDPIGTTFSQFNPSYIKLNIRILLDGSLGLSYLGCKNQGNH